MAKINRPSARSSDRDGPSQRLAVFPFASAYPPRAIDPRLRVPYTYCFEHQGEFLTSLASSESLLAGIANRSAVFETNAGAQPD